ncbi:secretion-regulating guanine nucleotide exchange factor isoform X2 [Cynocephalus volans]|uniref:secretion-regulating guanine nucleotide exchange factor isoform X2 n=1 Tax=Cynocephalus volans TaxID=110931 RepID=UPI002FC9FE46
MAREQGSSQAVPAAAALFAWGANSYGQLGLGHKEDMLLPQQLNDFCKPECVRSITGGGGHSAVVTDGGGLFVCGLNKDGQLGLGHTEDVLYFTLCKSLLGCPIQQVACGWDFTIILTAPEREGCLYCCWAEARIRCYSGFVFQWGTGLASSGRRLCPGQTLPLFLTAKEPSRVIGLENSKAICVLAGSDHSAALTDAGELYVWGSNKHGQLATQAAFLPMPQKIEARCFQNEKVTAVWSGWTHLVAQTETGKVFTWGRADYGQLGRKLESHEGCKPEKRDSFLLCSRPQNSTPSSLHCLTGANEAKPDQASAGCSAGLVPPQEHLIRMGLASEQRLKFSQSRKVSCGSEHNLAIIGGACYSWGWNEHGMCGDGTEANVWTPKPVQVLQLSSGLLVGCGAGHSLALCQLPAHPVLIQDPKATYPSPDAAEDPESQEAMDKERN